MLMNGNHPSRLQKDGATEEVSSQKIYLEAK
jgi:hypothetical protein